MFSSNNITNLAATQLSTALMDKTNIAELGLPTPPLGAFTGIPIVGITEHIAGPAALSTLVEDGALGINIEPPAGDPARRYLSHECFATFNAGKMSVMMKLREDENYIRILQEALIIIDNRSKKARDNDTVLQAFLKDPNKKNRIIYCYISGFPGEDEYRPGNDVTVQAATGIAYVNGPDVGQPLKVGFTVLDITTANWAVIAIQSRYIQMLRGIPIADETNKVIPVHVSLAGVAARFGCSQYLDTAMNRAIKQRVGNQDNYISVFSFFRAQDGLFLSIATLTDSSFKDLCHHVIARPDLSDKYPQNALRLQNNDYIHAEIQQVISTKPREHWLALLKSHGITHSEVSSVEEAVQKPFAKEVFSKTTDGTTYIARPDGRKPELSPAPKLNQHGDALGKLLAKSSKSAAYDFGKSKMHLLPMPVGELKKGNVVVSDNGLRRTKSR